MKRKPSKRKEFNAGVELFVIHMAELGLFLRREYRFHPERQWLFDFILDCGKSTILGGREFKLAFEIEGGIWVGGRHTRGKGYQEDLWKYAHATIDGWQIFRFSTEDVLNGTAKEFVRRWVDRAIATWKRG